MSLIIFIKVNRDIEIKKKKIGAKNGKIQC